MADGRTHRRRGRRDIAGFVVWRLVSAPAPPKEVTRFTIALPPGRTLPSNGLALALSDDGRELAYVATDKGTEVRQIHLRTMDSAEATPIPVTEGAIAPFFSPDGQWLGFFADGKLKKIAVAGGAPRTLADVTNSFGATLDHRPHDRLCAAGVGHPADP